MYKPGFQIDAWKMAPSYNHSMQGWKIDLYEANKKANDLIIKLLLVEVWITFEEIYSELND